MVGQSDLAFRLLCRRHGAQLVYTQMLDAARLVEEPEYRQQMFLSEVHVQDRPLVVQLSGNEPRLVAAAALLVENSGQADAIDFNLGCPQQAAANGMYGAYLLDRQHWPRVASIVAATRAAVSIPVCCKIRLLSTLEESIHFARLLQRAGCQLLVVHGRFRCNPKQRHRRKGAANLEWVAAIKSAMEIPVISNGNVRSVTDLARNLRQTGADGLMIAEAMLENPALLRLASSVPDYSSGRRVHGGGGSASVGRLAAEYLALAATHPPALGFQVVRQHITHMLGKRGHGAATSFKYALSSQDAKLLRERIVAASTIEELRVLVEEICSELARSR